MVSPANRMDGSDDVAARIYQIQPEVVLGIRNSSSIEAETGSCSLINRTEKVGVRPPKRSRKQIRRLARLIGEGGRRDANLHFVKHADAEGRRTLHSDPDRLDEVNQEITDFGCEVVAQYAVLGSYDFITVIQAADNESVAHLSLDLGSRGTVNIVTLPAISIAQLRAKLKGPKQMGRATRK
jgi:uncharacterized protein with GYD domain